MADTTITSTLNGAVFNHGDETESGTWTAIYNASGGLISVKDVDIVIDGPYGAETFTSATIASNSGSYAIDLVNVNDHPPGHPTADSSFKYGSLHDFGYGPVSTGEGLSDLVWTGETPTGLAAASTVYEGPTQTAPSTLTSAGTIANAVTETEKITGLKFKDGTKVKGTYVASYNSAGALTAIGNFSLSVTVNGKAVTLTQANTTATVDPAGTTATGQPLYQIQFVTNAGGAVSELYLDFTPDGTNFAATGTDGGEQRYTSIVDSNSNTHGFGNYIQVENSGALSPSPPCFTAGTRILTPSGDVAVELLQPGDLVTLADGRTAPLRWLGRSTLATRFADPLRAFPIRIAAGALGENLPKNDLLVSPDHAMFIDGNLVQAGALVNGRSITRETPLAETFVYYHVELATHELILAEGAPTESFVDNVDRMNFDNWDEHEAQFGNAGWITEMDVPRVKAARQLPASTNRRLAAIADTLLGTNLAAA
jgi:hypothetical protein